jgi:hypothetical protein
MSPQNFGRPRWRSLVALEAGHAMLGVENHSTALALYFAGRHRYRYHSDMPGQHWERAANEDQGTKARHSAVLCEFVGVTSPCSWHSSPCDRLLLRGCLTRSYCRLGALHPLTLTLAWTLHSRPRSSLVRYQEKQRIEALSVNPIRWAS